MSYVENSLLPGEHVTYETRLHKIVFFWPIVLAVLGFALFSDPVSRPAAPMVLGMAVLGGLAVWLQFSTSEFAVTNKRVIIKVGILRRRTLEIMLTKVEAISVDQSLGGQMLGYGTIVVVGTGGTHEPFKGIASPLEFRRAVQAAST